MFGHDNQDNNDNNGHDENNGGGQISLPPLDNNDEQVQPTTDTAPEVDSGAGDDLSLPNHRNITKSGAPTDDLLDIKQEALQALTPLVDHLEQTPEERFRTTMMMIQASDNHSLIKVAYDAAQKITNEKERAQALLDIVNEINYFTQHNQAA
jgi:hypothetical protein